MTNKKREKRSYCTKVSSTWEASLMVQVNTGAQCLGEAMTATMKEVLMV